jgi:uncharacterized membrane protein
MARKTKQMAARAFAHWRLPAAMVVGMIAWVIFKFAGAPRAAHLLLAWDSGAAAYLLTTWTLFLRADETEVRSRAAAEDEGVPVLLLIVLAAIAASLWAVVDAMIAAKSAGPNVKFMIATCAGATLMLSWLVLQSVFTLHYAHRHFGDGAGKPGIDYPGEPPTSYMDFAYLSFSVGATFQVSDNSILTSQLRKLVTAHAATAYFYNTAILALGINIIASLVGG